MNVLLDTHVLLWFVSGDDRLSSTARKLIEDRHTTNYVSIASWWELALKFSLGKLTLMKPLDAFIADRVSEGYRVLPIETQHVSALASLPFHHRDPFDRMIICQAMSESMPVCSGDRHFSDYDIKITW